MSEDVDGEDIVSSVRISDWMLVCTDERLVKYRHGETTQYASFYDVSIDTISDIWCEDHGRLRSVLYFGMGVGIVLGGVALIQFYILHTVILSIMTGCIGVVVCSGVLWNWWTTTYVSLYVEGSDSNPVQWNMTHVPASYAVVMSFVEDTRERVQSSS